MENIVNNLSSNWMYNIISKYDEFQIFTNFSKSIFSNVFLQKLYSSQNFILFFVFIFKTNFNYFSDFI